jgi:Fic family protein
MFKPVYTISDEVANKLSQIAEIKAMVQRSNLLPAREAFLRRAAVIKMAHSSTSIEGNPLDEFQVKQLAGGKRITAQADEIKEVENYLFALGKVDVLSDEVKTFEVKEILALHKIVMEGLVEKEKLGYFRSKPVYIVNVLPTGGEQLAYTPPPADQVLKLIESLVLWAKENDQIHPIIKAGLFHYQFETIHPFTDGNGRTGRLMTLLLLYQSGWDFKKVLVLEDYYNRDRKSYYEHLQTGKTYQERLNVDLTNWLNYFVEGFLQEALRVKDQILNLSLVNNIENNINILDVDELKIIDFVVSMGKITSSDVVDILKVPKRTAQSKLGNLEKIKVLKKQSAGPSTYYVIVK